MKEDDLTPFFTFSTMLTDDLFKCSQKCSMHIGAIDLFTDTAAILISIVSNGYYGMPREQIHINLPPEHPIMSFETIEIKMAAVSAKRSIVKTL